MMQHPVNALPALQQGIDGLEQLVTLMYTYYNHKELCVPFPLPNISPITLMCLNSSPRFTMRRAGLAGEKAAEEERAREGKQTSLSLKRWKRPESRNGGG